MNLINKCRFLGVLLCLVAFSSVQAAPFLKVNSTSNRPSPASQRISFNKKLVLKGSRGETLNFMVKLNSSKPGSFSFQALKRKKKNISLNLNPRFYSMETVTLLKQSYVNAKYGPHYDPLVPVTGEIVANEKNGKLFWGEITIPRNAGAGVVTGKLKFGNLSVPFQLTIWKMTMPETTIFPMYGNIEADAVELGHYQKFRDTSDWDNYVESLDATLMTKYLDMMREHNMFPVKSWIETPGVLPDGNGGEIFDIFDYPKPEVSYFNVTISKTPAKIYFDLPAMIYGYNGFDDVNDTSVTEPYYKAIQKSLEKLGRPKNAMTFLWDEPLAAWAETGKDDTPLLIQYASQVKSWAPDLKIMSTMPGKEEAAPYIDIFVPAPDYFGTMHDSIGETTIAGYRKLQRQGNEVWWYVSCMSHGCSSECEGCNESSGTPDMIIDRSASYIRSLAWLSAKYNIQAFFYFNLVQAYGSDEWFSGPGDPWTDSYRFAGNGDGNLFYPGRPGEHGLTEHQPIPSVRMKIWREATNDYQYIAWMNKLKKKPAWWEKRFNNLVKRPKRWSKNYPAYQTLRNKIGDYLNGRR